MNQQACIVPVDAGFKIQYTQGHPQARRRFAIAHELGHTLFFEEPGSTKAVSKLQGAEDPTIEGLCDFFARALLLPRLRFSDRIKYLDSGGRRSDVPPLHLIPILAQEFAVAPQAVARRMVFDVFESCCVVSCVKRNVGDLMAPWRAVWYAASVALHGHMPTGWRIALDNNGRRLPPELIPDVPGGETRQTMIDGRLHAAAYPQDPAESRKSLSRKPPLTSKSILVARYVGDSDLFRNPTEFAFLAIPNEYR